MLVSALHVGDIISTVWNDDISEWEITDMQFLTSEPNSDVVLSLVSGNVEVTRMMNECTGPHCPDPEGHKNAKQLFNGAIVETVPFDEPTPEQLQEVSATFLYDYRQRLGLSRREVQEATGLGGSVVWRADKSQHSVTAEQRTKIYDFLVAYETEHPEGKVKKGGQAAADAHTLKTIKELEQVRDEWMAATWELRNALNTYHDELASIITELKAKKVGTGRLHSLLLNMKQHTTEH